ncbi:Ribosome biogenesis protein BRX1 homolog [Gryllus bimaculatus]|nr:Ribosome biogenesis protein BRX1 homolog [Gryllus bimaculatus]
MVKLKAIQNTSGKKTAKTDLLKVKHGKVKKTKNVANLVLNSNQNAKRVQNVIHSVKDDGNIEVSNKEIVKHLKHLKKAANSSHFSNNIFTKSTPKEDEVASKTEVTLNQVSVKTKKNKKNKKKEKELKVNEKEIEEALPVSRWSDDPIPKKVHWKNRQRLLIFGCRGIGTRDRHLMKDIRRLLPHSKKENKMERRENLTVVNEVCTMKHCNQCILFEGRANRDVYMWISRVPDGPSVKFFLQNIYTMDELKFTGNCLVGSRPLLSFDENFENILHYRLIKELLVQIFGVPNHHPQSQPFFDHVFTFSVLDKRIWFRNYQILSEDGALVEIGPRFVMNPVKIFDKSFGGETIWENPHYVTPAKLRQLVRKAAGGKYVHKLNQKINQEKTKGQVSYKFPATDEVFTDDTWKTAKEMVSKSIEVGGPLKKKKGVKKNKGKKKSSQPWKVQAVGE